VEKYNVEFTEIFRFVHEMVDTEKTRTFRFIMGLREDIQRLSAAHASNNYATTLNFDKSTSTTFENLKYLYIHSLDHPPI